MSPTFLAEANALSWAHKHLLATLSLPIYTTYHLAVPSFISSSILVYSLHAAFSVPLTLAEEYGGTDCVVGLRESREAGHIIT